MSNTQASLDPPLSRIDRKRRDTRERIVEHAEKLMRHNPVNEITIQDITEAADIGHGTFYLHFKSKYEVLIPIVQRVAARWDRVIQANLQDIEDPAEVMAFSARHMGRMIVADPLWRWFLQHSGVPVEDLKSTLGRYSARDFGKGLLNGRLKVPELAISSSFLFGGFVNALLQSFDSDNPEKTIDVVVEMMLRLVGLDIEEAALMAHKPLWSLDRDLAG